MDNSTNPGRSEDGFTHLVLGVGGNFSLSFLFLFTSGH